MTIISPSILSCDFLNIEKELSFFDNEKDFWFHLDIMDGHFVPNLTFGHPIIKQIKEKTRQLLDAHLMVSNPAFYIDTFKDYNLHNITFHLEATDNPLDLINRAKINFKSVGISIKPKTKFSEIPKNILEKIDLLLIMSVEPGFGGQSFIEETYKKLDEINHFRKNSNSTFQIQVDGGVSSANAKKLITHGVDNLVAGSYIFSGSTQTYSQKVKSLRI